MNPFTKILLLFAELATTASLPTLFGHADPCLEMASNTPPAPPAAAAALATSDVLDASKDPIKTPTSGMSLLR